MRPPICNTLSLKQTRTEPTIRRSVAERQTEVEAVLILNDEERKVVVTALIDSGCTTSCIDKGFVQRAMITKKPMNHPIPARNTDGTINSNGMITHFVSVTLQIGNHREHMELPIVNLGKDDLFLGHDWLHLHNPDINWKDASVKFNSCPDECMGRSPTSITTEDVKLEEGEKLLSGWTLFSPGALNAKFGEKFEEKVLILVRILLSFFCPLS